MVGETETDDQHHHQQGKKERPDFARLAGKYDYFARHAMRTKKKNKSHEMDKVFIDFTSWQATHDLCRALLEEIGVKNWSIPKGHLVPGFTQRRNYCEWVESLLEKDGVQIEEENVRGVDVGTGASAIFALLFTSRHPKWICLAPISPRKRLRALGGTVWRRARRSVVVRTTRRLNKSSPQTTIIRTVIVVAVEVEDGLAFGTSRKRAAASLAKKKPKTPRRKKTNPSSTSTSSRKSASISPCAIHHSSTPCQNPPKIHEQILEARRKRTVTEVANRVSSGE